jgi:hypothetical protein
MTILLCWPVGPNFSSWLWFCEPMRSIFYSIEQPVAESLDRKYDFEPGIGTKFLVKQRVVGVKKMLA